MSLSLIFSLLTRPELVIYIHAYSSSSMLLYMKFHIGHRPISLVWTLSFMTSRNILSCRLNCHNPCDVKFNQAPLDVAPLGRSSRDTKCLSLVFILPPSFIFYSRTFVFPLYYWYFSLLTRYFFFKIRYSFIPLFFSRFSPRTRLFFQRSRHKNQTRRFRLKMRSR